MGFGSLPDWMIIGTQRGGTKSLFNYLIRHPGVKGPLRKEVHFFDLNYSRGVRWYKAFFPLHVGPRRDFVTGEASPYYLFHPHVPARVAQTLPDVKLLVLLRNPVDRAYSHYWHSVRFGYENLPFEEAMALEKDRMEGELARIQATDDVVSLAHRRYSYLSRGVYVDQLVRWVAHVPRERFLFLKSEDLFECPAPTFSRVLDFLGLEAWAPEFARYNAGEHARDMNAETRARLQAFFAPHNARLARFLDMGFDDWL
jgi:hypothetical protein